MIKEIGSEFWIKDLEKIKIKTTPSWIEKWGENTLTSSGSGALTLMLDQVEGEVIKKTVLLPSYTCESVILPFIKKGYECYFYDIKNNLSADSHSLNKFSETKIGIFLHMGYFGYPTNSSLFKKVNSFKKKGTIIIEDVTHTLFSDFDRFKENDYYIASLRKWLGIPSGGFLAYRDGFIGELSINDYDFIKLREEALLLKGEYIKTNNKMLKEKFLSMFNEAEDVLDRNVRAYSIDDNSLTILNKLDTDKLIKIRRENYLFLLNKLVENKAVKFIFNELPEKVCPMFFPIYFKKGRTEIRNELIENKIFCPIHWEKPKDICFKKVPKSQDIYANIMSIPCDQRYNLKDMRRIVEIINNITINI